MCLNHPDLVPKHPTHLATSVLVCFVRFDEVPVGSMRFEVLEPPRTSS